MPNRIYAADMTAFASLVVSVLGTIWSQLPAVVSIAAGLYAIRWYRTQIKNNKK